MADVTRTVHVRVLTFDPAQNKMIPVPGATLLCEDSGWLWDPNLSTGDPTTDADGRAQVEVTFDEEKESQLNPFFTIAIPQEQRAVPAGAPSERQLELPRRWVTRHYVNHRIQRLADHGDADHALDLFVGLDADLHVSYSDFDPSSKRNPTALPEDTVRIYLSDYDTFLWIDWLNPDDTLKGFTFDPKHGKVVPAGDHDEYPYFDVWPTAPYAFDGLPATPRAWTDPPGAPVGTLGGGSFQAVGQIATDPDGFVFVIDGDLIRRFYPDGTLCETIPDPSAAFSLSNPSGLALDQYRTLYVADTGNDRIIIFQPAFTEGNSGRYQFVGVVGTSGAATTQFNRPHGMVVVPTRVVDGLELLAVADTNNQRVQVFQIKLSDPALGAGAALTTSIRSINYPNIDLDFLCEFGGPGSGAGQFMEPVGVATDRSGRLFVCDRNLHRVAVWAPDVPAAPTTYTHQADWEKTGGGSGGGNREFDTPEAIAVDLTAGYAYVAESGNRRVQCLDADTGTHLSHWLHTYTPALTAPFTPTSVAVDARSEVYVADTTNHRVVRATRFEANGARRADSDPPLPVGAPWTPGSAVEHMSRPGYVCLGPDGKLWVADTGNDRVLAFERNAAGELVPSAAPDPTGMNRPTGLVVDTDGSLFVSDSGMDRIRHYSAALVHQVDFGGFGTGDDKFFDPRGMALVQRDQPLLFVADRLNNRVQIVRRDGTPVARIETVNGTHLKEPEDVAVDSLGNVFIADTGNGRIVQLIPPDNTFLRQLTVSIPGATAATSAPSGIWVDADDTLIVTDRAQNAVFRTDRSGNIVAFWTLENLLNQQVPNPSATPPQAGFFAYPDLQRQTVLDAPSRAVVDRSGLLTIADTGHDRIRLVRTYTSIKANLFDLGESLPDISFRAVTAANWTDELALKLNVGDVHIGDDSHSFTSPPEDDFAEDHYRFETMLGSKDQTNAAINVMQVIRTMQRWFQHQTRNAAEPAMRWGTDESAGLLRSHFTLNVDLQDGGSAFFLELNLDNESGNSPHGRGADAWDDEVVTHEATHWVFSKIVMPYPIFPLNPFRWADLTQQHGLDEIRTMNQALQEGWAEYVGLFWGEQARSTDGVRGHQMTFALRDVHEEGQPAVYVFGGASAAALPTFDRPALGLRCEGYFSSALYQLHHALVDASVQYADSPSYWYRYNTNVSDAQSRRYSDTIWQALKEFKKDPPFRDRASEVYLTRLLEQAVSEQTAFAQLVQSLFELNNQLMPTITITLGDSEEEPGEEIDKPVEIHELDTCSLVIQVADAAKRPLAGYVLNFTVDDESDWDFRPTAPVPTRAHGRVQSSGPTRGTNEHGIVRIVFEAPPSSANRVEHLTVSYQPDFDTDATFSPPEKGDDRETMLRRLYLYELRSAAKVWAGTDNNFGAIVSRSVQVKVLPT